MSDNPTSATEPLDEAKSIELTVRTDDGDKPLRVAVNPGKAELRRMLGANDGFPLPVIVTPNKHYAYNVEPGGPWATDVAIALSRGGHGQGALLYLRPGWKLAMQDDVAVAFPPGGQAADAAAAALAGNSRFAQMFDDYPGQLASAARSLPRWHRLPHALDAVWFQQLYKVKPYVVLPGNDDVDPLPVFRDPPPHLVLGSTHSGALRQTYAVVSRDALFTFTRPQHRRVIEAMLGKRPNPLVPVVIGRSASRPVLYVEDRHLDPGMTREQVRDALLACGPLRRVFGNDYEDAVSRAVAELHEGVTETVIDLYSGDTTLPVYVNPSRSELARLLRDAQRREDDVRGLVSKKACYLWFGDTHEVVRALAKKRGDMPVIPVYVNSPVGFLVSSWSGSQWGLADDTIVQTLEACVPFRRLFDDYGDALSDALREYGIRGGDADDDDMGDSIHAAINPGDAVDEALLAVKGKIDPRRALAAAKAQARLANRPYYLFTDSAGNMRMERTPVNPANGGVQKVHPDGRVTDFTDASWRRYVADRENLGRRISEQEEAPMLDEAAVGRRYFYELAKNIRMDKSITPAHKRKAVALFAEIFAAINPRFQPDRFSGACGVNMDAPDEEPATDEAVMTRPTVGLGSTADEIEGRVFRYLRGMVSRIDDETGLLIARSPGYGRVAEIMFYPGVDAVPQGDRVPDMKTHFLSVTPDMDVADLRREAKEAARVLAKPVTTHKRWYEGYELDGDGMIDEMAAASRKDFQAAAEIIKSRRKGLPKPVIAYVVNELSRYFREKNQMFDKGRFLRAAAVTVDGDLLDDGDANESIDEANNDYKVPISRLGLSSDKQREIQRIVRELPKMGGEGAWELLEKANEILGGYGVEVIGHDDLNTTARGPRDYWQYAVMAYVNMGDSYKPTVCLDLVHGEAFVGKWGTWLEKLEIDYPSEEPSDESIDEKLVQRSPRQPRRKPWQVIRHDHTPTRRDAKLPRATSRNPLEVEFREWRQGGGVVGVVVQDDAPGRVWTINGSGQVNDLPRSEVMRKTRRVTPGLGADVSMALRAKGIAFTTVKPDEDVEDYGDAMLDEMARKGSTDAAAALAARKRFSRQNRTVRKDGDTWVLALHGNDIAKIENGKLWITLAGWDTPTTRDTLNTLPGVRVHTAQGQAYLNGQEWDGKWIEVGDAPAAPSEAYEPVDDIYNVMSRLIEDGANDATLTDTVLALVEAGDDADESLDERTRRDRAWPNPIAQGQHKLFAAKIRAVRKRGEPGTTLHRFAKRHRAETRPWLESAVSAFRDALLEGDDHAAVEAAADVLALAEGDLAYLRLTRPHLAHLSDADLLQYESTDEAAWGRFTAKKIGEYYYVYDTLLRKPVNPEYPLPDQKTAQKHADAHNIEHRERTQSARTPADKAHEFDDNDAALIESVAGATIVIPEGFDADDTRVWRVTRDEATDDAEYESIEVLFTGTRAQIEEWAARYGIGFLPNTSEFGADLAGNGCVLRVDLDEAAADIPGLSKWLTFAGGTGAHNPEHRSYSLRLPVGTYYIDPPQRRAGSWSIRFANDKGRVNQPGLWREVGTARSANEAVSKVREDYAALKLRDSAPLSKQEAAEAADYLADLAQRAAKAKSMGTVVGVAADDPNGYVAASKLERLRKRYPHLAHLPDADLLQYEGGGTATVGTDRVGLLDELARKIGVDAATIPVQTDEATVTIYLTGDQYAAAEQVGLAGLSLARAE